MSDASTAAGVDHGAGAELDPFARSDYFALRAGIQRVTVQLQACQAMLGAGALAAATGQWPASGLMTAGAAGTNALGRAVMRPSRVERLSRSTTLSGPASLGGLQAPFPK
ncbi:lysis system i-spanin subunit Rz [Achromobacter xylosoxidans]